MCDREAKKRKCIWDILEHFLAMLLGPWHYTVLAFCTRAKHFKRRGLLFSFVSLGFYTVPGL